MIRNVSFLLRSAALALLLLPASPAFAHPDWAARCSNHLEREHERIDADSLLYTQNSRDLFRDRARMEARRHWCAAHSVLWNHDRFDGGIYAVNPQVAPQLPPGPQPH